MKRLLRLLHLSHLSDGKTFAEEGFYGRSLPHADERPVNAMLCTVPTLTPAYTSQVPSLTRAVMIIRTFAAGLAFSAFSAFSAEVPVHVGGPSIAIAQQMAAGDDIRVPLYLSNFSTQEITQVSFTVRYDEARLDFVDAESQITADFDLTLSNASPSNGRVLSFTAKNAGLSYGATPLVVLRFTPQGGSGNTSISITQGQVQDDANQTMADAQINLINQNRLASDINGDGIADLSDVDAAFEYVTQTSRTDRARGNLTYDFSGKLATCAHDVALLQRHILGLNPTLPVLTSDTATPTRTNVQLALSLPSALGGGYYRYVLRGTNTAGLLSGEFTLPLNTSIFQSVSLAQSATGEVRTKMNVSNGVLYVHWVGLEPLIEAGNDLLQITVKHKTTTNTSAFTGTPNAYLNEGAFRSNWPSVLAGNETQVVPTRLQNAKLHAPMLRARDGRLHLLPSQGDMQSRAFDASGRSIRLP